MKSNQNKLLNSNLRLILIYKQLMNEIIMIGQGHDRCILCPFVFRTGEAPPSVLCSVLVPSKNDFQMLELVQRRAVKLVES